MSCALKNCPCPTHLPAQSKDNTVIGAVFDSVEKIFLHQQLRRVLPAVFGLGVLAIGGGLLLRLDWLPKEWVLRTTTLHLLGDLMAEVGKAAVASTIMAATVDLLVKTRLVREAVKGVATRLRAPSLPDDFRAEVDATFDTEIIRRDYRSHYVFQLTDDKKHVIITHKANWKAENLADDKRPHTHGVWLSVPRTPGLPKNANRPTWASGQNVAFDGPTGPLTAYELDDEALAAESQFSPDWVMWKKAVYLLPSKVHGPAVFRHESRMIAPLAWLEPMTFLTPTCGIELRVDFPPELDVRVEFSHRQLVEPLEPTRFGRGCKIWSLDQVFLKNTGYEVSWSPPTGQAEEAQQSSTAGTSTNMGPATEHAADTQGLQPGPESVSAPDASPAVKPLNGAPGAQDALKSRS